MILFYYELTIFLSIEAILKCGNIVNIDSNATPSGRRRHAMAARESVSGDDGGVPLLKWRGKSLCK